MIVLILVIAFLFTLLCLMGPKFHTSEPRGSEEEYFQYFPLYFYGSNPGSSGEDPYGQWSHSLNKLGLESNFKQLSLAVPEKKILGIFYLRTQDPFG